ncbi:MAG: polysaccharide biosynthesis C-terminal domain-containing protein [Anaerolineae bacterium]|nr:polysaccharide biosynthesis C-terminal domain-containing protein [Anaerolineae bacterium]
MAQKTTLESPPLHDPADADQHFSSGAARRAARNATALALSNITSKGLMFAWQLILARWLGSAGYGVYGTIGALVAIGAAIPEFGMGLMVIRDVATSPKDAGRYLAATLTMQPVLAAAGYVVLMLAALLLGYDTDLRALLAFAAVNLLVDALGNMCHNQLLAVERMVLPAIIAAGHVALLMALATIALATDAGLWGLYTATLIAGLARTGVYWIVLLRTGTRPVFPLDRVVAWGLVVNGAPLALTSFLSLAYSHTDKLITTALIGTDDTGQLTAGFVIVFGVIELLSTTVLVAVFPLMSRTYSSGQQTMFDFMLEKLAFFNLTLSLPIGIYTSLLAVPLSSLVFGPDYTRTADILRYLIWYTVVTMVGNVFSKALLVQNRQRLLLIIRSGGLGLNILLNLILLPELGVVGAAVATLIAEAVILVTILYVFDLSSDWWQRMINHLWRLGVAALALAGTVLLLREVHPLLAAVVGAPVYAGLVLVSGAVAQDDWDLIYRLAMAMPGGTRIGRYWKRQLA